MRGFLLDAVLSLLLVLCFSSSVFASGTREIRVSKRPPGIPSNIVRWAYTDGGTLITSDAGDFDKRVSRAVVFVYDPKAPASDTAILPTRGGRIDKTGGSTAPRPKTWDESAAQRLACAGATASLTSCKGEEGGSPHGVVGGANPRASSSPAKQAIFSGAVILLTMADLRRIATDATRAVFHKLTGSATREAVEKAALEAAEKAWKQGGRHGSREAVERAAQEAAKEASRGAPLGSAAKEGLQTTAHGAERIAGAAATRGGVLSEAGVAAVRQGGRVMTQADGATVRILQNQAGRFNVVVEGKRGIITTFENLSQKSLDRLVKNYDWK
jgi:hypothetical protein